MSRRRVVTGADERGRPIAAWEGGSDAPLPAYGHMEPAYDATKIERRQATDEDRARWAAAARPSPIAPTTAHVGRYAPEELQDRRRRGQRAMRAAIAAPPPEEDRTVTADALDPVAEQRLKTLEEELPAGPFTDIAAAALEAARRHERVLAARIAAAAADDAYQESLAVLEAAWADAGMTAPLVVPGPGRTVTDEELAAIRVAAAPAAVKSKRASAKAPKAAKTLEDRALDRDARAALVMAALERHGGDAKAAGQELGLRTNVVTLVAKAARARAAA